MSKKKASYYPPRNTSFSLQGTPSRYQADDANEVDWKNSLPNVSTDIVNVQQVIDSIASGQVPFIQVDGTSIQGDGTAASPLFASGVGGGDHSILTNLSNDDHPQYLLVNGNRAMAGHLDMGTRNITNVGTIGGVNIGNHKARHAPGGADALTTLPAVTLTSATTNTEGSAAAFARSDHTHQIDITGFSHNSLTGLTTGNPHTQYLQKSGGTMTGALVLNADPTVALHPVTLQYLNANVLDLGGGTLTGFLTLHDDPSNPLHAATKQYADSVVTNYLPLSGGTLTGALTLNGVPSAEFHAANKGYVDNGLANYLPLAGGTLGGDVDMDGNNILNVGSLVVDDLTLDNATILGTVVNGDISITPNGTGQVLVPTPTVDSAASTKLYVDNGLANYLPLAGGTMTGAIDMDGQNLTNIGPGNLDFPTADGTNGQAITTNGSGTLSFTTINTVGGLIDAKVGPGETYATIQAALNAGYRFIRVTGNCTEASGLDLTNTVITTVQGVSLSIDQSATVTISNASTITAGSNCASLTIQGRGALIFTGAMGAATPLITVNASTRVRISGIQLLYGGTYGGNNPVLPAGAIDVVVEGISVALPNTAGLLAFQFTTPTNVVRDCIFIGGGGALTQVVSVTGTFQNIIIRSTCTFASFFDTCLTTINVDAVLTNSTSRELIVAGGGTFSNIQSIGVDSDAAFVLSGTISNTTGIRNLEATGGNLKAINVSMSGSLEINGATSISVDRLTQTGLVLIQDTVNSATITDSSFASSTALSADVTTVTGCTFTGAVSVTSTAQVTFSNCKFLSTTAAYPFTSALVSIDGCAFVVQDNQLTITDTEMVQFTNNHVAFNSSAAVGNFLVLADARGFVVSNNVFRPETTGNVRGISATGSTTIGDAVIQGNRIGDAALSAASGGISLTLGAAVTNMSVIGNTVGSLSLAAECTGLVFSNNTVAGSASVDSTTQGIITNNMVIGAFAITGSSAFVRCTIMGNTVGSFTFGAQAFTDSLIVNNVSTAAIPAITTGGDTIVSGNLPP